MVGRQLEYGGLGAYVDTTQTFIDIQTRIVHMEAPEEGECHQQQVPVGVSLFWLIFTEPSVLPTTVLLASG